MKNILVLLVVLAAQSAFSVDGRNTINITRVDDKGVLIGEDPVRNIEYMVIINCPSTLKLVPLKSTGKKEITLNIYSAVESTYGCTSVLSAIMSNIDIEDYALEYNTLNNVATVIRSANKKKGTLQ